MAFGLDAIAIFFGSMLGTGLKNKINNNAVQSFFKLTGIIIIVMSISGIITKIVTVNGTGLSDGYLLEVLFAMMIGSAAGEFLNIDAKINGIRLKKSGKNEEFTESFIYSTVFFAVGALQIAGPLNYVISGDSTFLAAKAIVDFPFALSLAIAFGKGVALSSIPVTVLQLLIGGLAFVFGDVISAELIAKICAAGYIVLLCLGLNIISDGKTGFKTVNMLPSFLILIIFDIFFKG